MIDIRIKAFSKWPIFWSYSFRSDPFLEVTHFKVTFSKQPIFRSDLSFEVTHFEVSNFSRWLFFRSYFFRSDLFFEVKNLLKWLISKGTIFRSDPFRSDLYFEILISKSTIFRSYQFFEVIYFKVTYSSKYSFQSELFFVVILFFDPFLSDLFLEVTRFRVTNSKDLTPIIFSDKCDQIKVSKWSFRRCFCFWRWGRVRPNFIWIRIRLQPTIRKMWKLSFAGTRWKWRWRHRFPKISLSFSQGCILQTSAICLVTQ